MVLDGHRLEMLLGQSTRVLVAAGRGQCKMIHGLIKCREVNYDFYNVAVSPAYVTNSFMSLYFINTELK